jgi:hypothetical protein
MSLLDAHGRPMNRGFKPRITLSRALADPELFGSVFAAPSFWPWRTIGKLIDGIELREPREVELFEQCTGRKYNRFNRRAVRRLIILAGRRAGKDRFSSAVAVWRAALCADWRRHQSLGEGSVVILLGADKKHSTILAKYCRGLLSRPKLAPEVSRHTKDIVEFKNGASLEIVANDARLVRGRSAIGVFGSECCHWRTDEFAASSDEEVVGAAEPSMAMSPDGVFLMLGSSVYRKAGYMYRKYSELYGNEDADDDAGLVWFAPSAVMNPRLRPSVIEAALRENAAKANAEYNNVWREDLTGFIPADAVMACTDAGVFERPPEPGIKYLAFDDAASGTGTDSFAVAITSRGGPDQPHILHAIKEFKPRFDPHRVIAELVPWLRSYRINEIQGDRFGAGFHSSIWEAHGFKFTPCEYTTSENYLTMLPLLLAGRDRVRLVQSATLYNQLISLERSVYAHDREAVDHPRHAGAHDDVAAAVAGALALCVRACRGGERLMRAINGYNDAAMNAAIARVYGRGGFVDYSRPWWGFQ